MHQCRKHFRALLEPTTMSYYRWLTQSAEFNGYAWTYDELECLDNNCGYNSSPDTPAASLDETACGILQNCTAFDSGYTCGSDPNVPAYDLTGSQGCTTTGTWWDTPGCKANDVNPQPDRNHGLDQALAVIFQKLSWMPQQDVLATLLLGGDSATPVIF